MLNHPRTVIAGMATALVMAASMLVAVTPASSAAPAAAAATSAPAATPASTATPIPVVPPPQSTPTPRQGVVAAPLQTMPVTPAQSTFFATAAEESYSTYQAHADGDLWPSCWADDGNLYAAN